MWVQSLGQEDPLEEGMATHSSVSYTWEIPWTEGPGGLQSIGSQRTRCDLSQMHILQPTTHFPFPGESLNQIESLVLYVSSICFC